MRTTPQIIAAAVLCLIIFAPGLAAAAPDTTTTISGGMEKVAGPGWDFYGPIKKELNSQGLFMIVNYGNEPITVTLTRQNNETGIYETLYSRGIAPGSSQYLTLSFPTPGREYQVILIAASEQLHIQIYTRPTYTVVFPPNTWQPPLEETDPNVYTELQWQEMVGSFWALIAQITMETVVIVSFMAAGGLALGVVVKSKIKFVAPTDPISSIIIIGGTIDAIAGFSPMGLYWLPLLACYIIGYLIYYIEYFSPILTNCETRRIDIKPYVIYYPDNGTTPAIQPQTWRGLYKRAVGHHHTLSADGSLNGDWKVSLKKPLWPLLSTAAVFVERQETEIRPVKSRLGTLKVSSTKLILASGSQLNKIDLLVSINKFLEFKDRWKEDRVRLTELELQSQTQAIDTAADLLTAGINVSPSLVVSRMLKRNKEAVNIEKLENEFSHLEDRITELPEDEQQIEDEAEDEE